MSQTIETPQAEPERPKVGGNPGRIQPRARIPTDEDRREPEISLDRSGRPVYANASKPPGMVGAIAGAATNIVVAEALNSGRGATTPMQMLLAQSYTAFTIARLAKRQFSHGYAAGQRMAGKQRRTSAFLRTGDLSVGGPETPAQLVRDLVALSANGKTTLDPNRRLAPDVVAERSLRMIASGSPFKTSISLPDLGIRPSPNLIDALQNYTRGGRRQLVHARLVEPNTHIERHLEAMEAATRQKAAETRNETTGPTRDRSRKPEQMEI